MGAKSIIKSIKVISLMTNSFQQQQELYAELLVKIGVNLQPGQSVRIGGKVAQADFIRLLTVKAYEAGAKYVHVDWQDAPVDKARMEHSDPAYLDFLPGYETARMREMVDDTWARIALVGDEFPNIYETVDPTIMRKLTIVRNTRYHFYSEAQMANRLQWTVAAVPTPAWSQQVFPSLSVSAAMRRMWQEIFKLTRVDQPDPIAAWREHVTQLQTAVNFMAENQITAVRFVDSKEIDGKPATNLTVPLAPGARWEAGSVRRPDGLEFLPNMPTEEMFTTPHNAQTEGWVRTSKPCFPMERRVENAWFHFKKGEVVDFGAEVGADALKEFFQIKGAKRLGEVALVDERSPVNRSRRIFFETLFDENAACHIAFGKAYPDIVKGAAALNDEQRMAIGINIAHTHVDFMIGTPTMNVIGITADGREIPVMKSGRFTDGVLRGKSSGHR